MFNLLLAVIYLAFISLGLPDALLGSAWPSMYPQFGVPLSYAGIISMTISIGTIISSLQSDRLTRRFGTGKVTMASVAMTAFALFGFSISSQYWQLLVWAVPYGLGAGSVDASLNNYVALHYKSYHMSWLHCMWGVGISTGPYVMSFALTHGMSWNMGYRAIFMLQVILTVILIFSLPLWKKPSEAVNNKKPSEMVNDQKPSEAINSRELSETTNDQKPSEAVNDRECSSSAKNTKPLSLLEVIAIQGAKEVLITFFCYCALEQTCILWGASFLTLGEGMDAQEAASFASLFCIGITIGRAISGFMTMKFNDTQMIRIGIGIILTGSLLILLPLGLISSMAGLIIVGLGCAPVYPCVIHSTPAHFGAENSQAVIGVQMAFAYCGSTLMPPLFGLIATHITIRLFPVFLLIILALMFFMHERLIKITA